MKDYKVEFVTDDPVAVLNQLPEAGYKVEQLTVKEFNQQYQVVSTEDKHDRGEEHSTEEECSSCL